MVQTHKDTSEQYLISILQNRFKAHLKYEEPSSVIFEGHAHFYRVENKCKIIFYLWGKCKNSILSCHAALRGH